MYLKIFWFSNKIQIQIFQIKKLHDFKFASHVSLAVFNQVWYQATVNDVLITTITIYQIVIGALKGAQYSARNKYIRSSNFLHFEQATYS